MPSLKAKSQTQKCSISCVSGAGGAGCAGGAGGAGGSTDSFLFIKKVDKFTQSLCSNENATSLRN